MIHRSTVNLPITCLVSLWVMD